jgi:hypothetical protein
MHVRSTYVIPNKCRKQAYVPYHTIISTISQISVPQPHSLLLSTHPIPFRPKSSSFATTTAALPLFSPPLSKFRPHLLPHSSSSASSSPNQAVRHFTASLLTLLFRSSSTALSFFTICLLKGSTASRLSCFGTSAKHWQARERT